MRTARASWSENCSERSAAPSCAAARGSQQAAPAGSLATSSDCTTIRAGASSASTS
jgi:hypothetical protein